MCYAGSDIPTSQVQHSVSDKDCCGARESVRTAQDVGRSEESEQVVPPTGHQGEHECVTVCP